LPCGGGGIAYRHGAAFNRTAAGGIRFVRRAAGVGGDERDRTRLDDELFRGDLQQRGLDALAQLGLAGEHGDAAIGGNANPRVERRLALEGAR